MGTSASSATRRRDVRGVAADGAEHGPDLFVVDHLDDLVAGGAPECAESLWTIRRKGLPP